MKCRLNVDANKVEKSFRSLAYQSTVQVAHSLSATHGDGGIVVSIAAFQAVDPGSIPG